MIKIHWRKIGKFLMKAWFGVILFAVGLLWLWGIFVDGWTGGGDDGLVCYETGRGIDCY